MENITYAKNMNTCTCSRCGDEKPVNKYGVCDHCDHEIDAEYMDLYNLQNMEN